MVRGKVVPEKALEEPRLDSGAALSDPSVLSDPTMLFSGSGKLTMPTLRNTNWNYGTPKARYRKNELQLRQPKGFPIKVLKTTLAHAREEAELEAAAKRYADPDFEVYEDEDDEDEVEEEDGYEFEVEHEDDEAENVAEDLAPDSADGGANDSDVSTGLPTFKVIAKKPAALIDSRGRTRAATTRRKAQEAFECTMQPQEDTENATANDKKRKQRRTQAAKQSRKTLPKKSV